MNGRPAEGSGPGRVILVCLFAVSCGGGTRPSSPAEPVAASAGWFEDATATLGPAFVHETGATGRLLLPEVMGGGVALFDADNDGDLDAYLTNGNHHLPGGSKQGPTPNRLFLQRDGRFVEASEESGLDDEGYGMGVAVGDVDNDGDLDVYLTNYGPDRLYLNGGDGRFDEVTAPAGIDVDGWSASATFFDYDRDGFLDLYVARYVEYDDARGCSDAAGRPDYCSPAAFRPSADVLLRNRGDGTFDDVSETAGVGSVRAAGLGVVAGDLDDDGWPDVYVANDGYANQLWINQGDGTFRDEAVIRGVAYDLHGKAEAGMGVLAADLDNDLDDDLFVTHLAQETNTLYGNRLGGRGFVDETGFSGLAVGSLAHTGFGTAAIDLGLDGRLDLVVLNGRVTLGDPRPGSATRDPWNRLVEPNLLFLNRGDGRFEAAGDEGVALTAPLEVSRGLATGDVDGDGDLDLLYSNLQSTARLLLDVSPRSGHWLLVRALDPRYRREAIGAQVSVFAGEFRRRARVQRGFGYLSSSDARVHFGLGHRTAVDGVEVRWPDGRVETFAVDGVDRSVTLARGEGVAR